MSEKIPVQHIEEEQYNIIPSEGILDHGVEDHHEGPDGYELDPLSAGVMAHEPHVVVPGDAEVDSSTVSSVESASDEKDGSSEWIHPLAKMAQAVEGRADTLRTEGHTEKDAIDIAEDNFYGIANDTKTPLQRMGDAVEASMRDLQSEGASEVESHKDTYDEFWGAKKPLDVVNSDKPESEKKVPGTDLELWRGDSSDGEVSMSTPIELGPVKTPLEIGPAKTPIELGPAKVSGTETPLEIGQNKEISKSPELLEAEKRVAVAREEFARMRAGRERATFFSREFSKKNFDAAEKAYKSAQLEAGKIAVELLRGEGFAGKELASAINYGSAEEALSLITEQYNQEAEFADSLKLKSFYEWYNKQGSKLFSVGTVKKAAALAAVTAPLGLALAIIGPGAAVGATAGAGLAIASRVSKGMLGSRIKRNAGAKERLDSKHAERLGGINALIDSIEAGDKEYETDEDIAETLNETVDRATAQTNESKRQNDRRARRTIAAAVVLGTAAQWMPGVIDNIQDRFIGVATPEAPSLGYSTQDALEDRVRGIGSAGVTKEEFSNFFENLPEGTQPLPELVELDNVWNSIKGGLDVDQSQTFNKVVGSLSSVEGFGNSWTVDNYQQILDLMNNGMNDPDQIVETIKLTKSA